MTIFDSGVCLPARDGCLSADEWPALMDRHGIARAVVAPSDEFVAYYDEAANEHVAGLVTGHPQRLLGLAVAVPWRRDAARVLDLALTAGLIGLYVNPALQGVALTSARLDPLVEVCAARGRPVYAHTGTPGYAEPFQLSELARRHPTVTFIMGHMSWTDFCGYDVIPAARQAPNILLETSCAAAPVVKLACEVLGATRLLFGSGYPASDPGVEIAKIGGLGLSKEALALVMGENAERVWGLPRRETDAVEDAPQPKT